MSLAAILALILLFAIWRAVARVNRNLYVLVQLADLLAAPELHRRERDYTPGAVTSTHPCGQERR